MRYYPALFMCFASVSWAQEMPSKAAIDIKKANESFNELSDISRIVDEKLKSAQKSGDMEKVQCISSRQASIAALAAITKQAQTTMEANIGGQNPMRAKSELKKIEVALAKARQYEKEVETCLNLVKQKENPDQTTEVDVDKSAVAELLVGDEATFGLNTPENSVSEMTPQTTTESTSSDISSESVPPPSESSPYY